MWLGAYCLGFQGIPSNNCNLDALETALPLSLPALRVVHFLVIRVYSVAAVHKDVAVMLLALDSCILDALQIEN
jgi:hypothetical protein